MTTNYLHEWLFYYNGYDKLWYAFTRESKDDYFNGTDNKYIKSKNIDTLMFIIVKAEGKFENIKNVINE
jgi:hypothetical protein